MTFKFYKCNPTENMTILVMDPVNVTQRAAIANHLMAENHLHAEQVGFVTLFEAQRGDMNLHARLEMMGGEFCANATRSLAAVLAFKGMEGPYRINVSGVKDPITCQVRSLAGMGSFQASAELPLPLHMERMNLSYENHLIHGVLVEFPGITHLVVEADAISNQEAFFHHSKGKWEHLGADAFGVMYYHGQNNYLEPLVWVRDTDTLFWERGCGSGTAATGAYLASQENKSNVHHIQQPGGTLTIHVQWDQGVQRLCLDGEVSIVAEGIAYVNV